MNKLITIFDKLKICILPLFFVLALVSVNAQENPSESTQVQDTVPTSNNALDTIYPVNRDMYAKPKDSVQSLNKATDTIPKTTQNTDTIFPVNRGLITGPKPEMDYDSLPLTTQPKDTIPQKQEIREPIILDKNKKYMLGGISVDGIQTISEQSILIFSGLNTGQLIKVPGDKLSAAIKKLWGSKLFSNVDVFVTRIDGDVIYLEISVTELDRVGQLTIKGVKKSKIEEIQMKLNFKVVRCSPKT